MDSTAEDDFQNWWASEIDGKRKIMELTYLEAFTAGRAVAIAEIRRLKELNEEMRRGVRSYQETTNKAMADGATSDPSAAKATLPPRESGLPGPEEPDRL